MALYRFALSVKQILLFSNQFHTKSYDVTQLECFYVSPVLQMTSPLKVSTDNLVSSFAFVFCSQINSTSERAFPTPISTMRPNKAKQVASRYSSSSLEDEAKRVTVLSTLELEMGTDSFQYGKARLQCHGSVWGLWDRNNVLILEEERPRLASVIGTGESSAGT